MDVLATIYSAAGNGSADKVNRYFFNFRSGGDIAQDMLGMYLPDLNAARAEALDTCRALSIIAELDGKPVVDCELQVSDASGETLLHVPVMAGNSAGPANHSNRR